MPKLPIHKRDGSVRCYALVSVKDLTWASKLKWHMTGTYPATSTYLGNRKSTDTHLHRMVMGLKKGDPREVDHINGKELDARRCNLRIATSRQNKQNRHRPYSRRKYKLARGVTYCKANHRYYAGCTVNYKFMYLGCFTNKVAAAKAASKGRKRYGFRTNKRG